MIRKAKLKDLDEIFNVRLDARQRMKNINIDQWQDEEPTKERFLNDIILKRAYVMTIEEEIVGIITLQFEPEGSYFKYINNEEKYLTCHRIAIKNGFTQKGYAKKLLKFAEDLALKRKIKKIYIDTHPNNLPMKNLIKKMGYKYLKLISLSYLRSKKRELHVKFLSLTIV